MATDMINSGIATAIAEMATLPICIVKTNYQNSSHTVPEVVRKIYNTGGVLAFYRASAPSVGSQMLSTSTKYTFYRAIDKHSDSKVLSGICSGVMSSIITHPVDFVKVHRQMGTPIGEVVRANGLAVVYRGYTKSLSKVVIGSALFYPIYDYARSMSDSATLSAFASAVISTTVMHPVDYLKTRHIFGGSPWSGADPRVYYRGLILNLSRVVPHFMITMYCIDALERSK